MDKIPEHFRRRIQEAKEKHLKELYLSNSHRNEDQDKLTKIPELVFELKHIQVLDVSYNRIDELPELLSKLTNLRVLDLRANQLSSLPDFIGQLTNLNSLVLGQNKISTLP